MLADALQSVLWSPATTPLLPAFPDAAWVAFGKECAQSLSIPVHSANDHTSLFNPLTSLLRRDIYRNQLRSKVKSDHMHTEKEQ